LTIMNAMVRHKASWAAP